MTTPRTYVTLIAILVTLLLLLVFEDKIARRTGVIGYLATYSTKQTLSLAPRFRRSKITSCLKTQFEKYGSSLDNLALSPLLSNSNTFPPVLLIAASNKGYAYASAWQMHRVQERTPFIVFTSRGSLRNGELAAHYARIPALLASISCLPRARLLTYTDMDTLVNVSNVPALVRNSTRPVSISWKKERTGITLRTNWLVVKRDHPDAVHFLLTWFYNGRKAQYQDQTVLNDLYRQKPWFRELINVLRIGTSGTVELKHCFSALKNRKECIQSLKLENYVKTTAKATK